jgi:hypothetical protein
LQKSHEKAFSLCHFAAVQPLHASARIARASRTAIPLVAASIKRLELESLRLDEDT